MCALAYRSMVRATSLPVVALSPRVVHHCKLASRGTPLIPANISPIQWKPGTQMGRPVGGLKKPGLMRLRRFALLEITAASVLRRPDFPVFLAHNYPDIRQHGLSGFLQPLHKRFGPVP
jgi:hypothetical protein